MKTFSARETVWLQKLDGLELASFHRRAFAFLIVTAEITMEPVEGGTRYRVLVGVTTPNVKNRTLVFFNSGWKG